MIVMTMLLDTIRGSRNHKYTGTVNHDCTVLYISVVVMVFVIVTKHTRELETVIQFFSRPRGHLSSASVVARGAVPRDKLREARCQQR